jgi:hypothetical protein
MSGTIGYQKLVAAAALIVLYLLGGELPGWSVAGAAAALLAALCAIETAAS